MVWNSCMQNEKVIAEVLLEIKTSLSLFYIILQYASVTFSFMNPEMKYSLLTNTRILHKKKLRGYANRNLSALHVRPISLLSLEVSH